MNLRKLFTIVLAVGSVSAPAFAQLYSAYFAYPGFVAGTQLSVGGTAVYFVGSSESILYKWDPVHQQTYAIQFPNSVRSVATGGGSSLQSDETWMIDTLGGLWRWDTTTTGFTTVFNPISTDSRFQQVVVGPGYTDSCHPYEVWVSLHDTTLGGWFAERYNYCKKVLEAIPASPSPTGPAKLSTGGGEVWALNSSNQVFRFNPSADLFVQMPGALAQIAVGVDGVWGLNANGAVFEFNSASQAFNSIPVLGKITAIAAGGYGMWCLNSSGQALHYEASTRTFQIEGPSIDSSSYINIAVGNAGVWINDAAGDYGTYETEFATP